MILVISNEKKRACAVSQILHYMGMLSYPTTPSAALSEISPIYRAVLILNPQSLPDPKDYIKRIHSYVGSMPLFSINDDNIPTNISDLFLKNYNRSFSPKIAVDIMLTLKENNMPIVGIYRLAGIDASVHESVTRYFEEPISFTFTESMILRCLIRSYPIPVSTDYIIKHAFNPGKRPETSCVRTHISVMNKKFEKVSERRLIISVPKQGYVILTPEISENIISL